MSWSEMNLAPIASPGDSLNPAEFYADALIRHTTGWFGETAARATVRQIYFL